MTAPPVEDPACAMPAAMLALAVAVGFAITGGVHGVRAFAHSYWIHRAAGSWRA